MKSKGTLSEKSIGTVPAPGRPHLTRSAARQQRRRHARFPNPSGRRRARFPNPLGRRRARFPNPPKRRHARFPNPSVWFPSFSLAKNATWGFMQAGKPKWRILTCRGEPNGVILEPWGRLLLQAAVGWRRANAFNAVGGRAGSSGPWWGTRPRRRRRPCSRRRAPGAHRRPPRAPG